MGCKFARVLRANLIEQGQYDCIGLLSSWSRHAQRSGAEGHKAPGRCPRLCHSDGWCHRQWGCRPLFLCHQGALQSECQLLKAAQLARAPAKVGCMPHIWVPQVCRVTQQDGELRGSQGQSRTCGLGNGQAEAYGCIGEGHDCGEDAHDDHPAERTATRSVYDASLCTQAVCLLRHLCTHAKHCSRSERLRCQQLVVMMHARQQSPDLLQGFHET